MIKRPLDWKRRMDGIEKQFARCPKFHTATKRVIYKELDHRKPRLVYEYRFINGWYYYLCPSCGIPIEMEYVPYCATCGQALKWYGYRKYKKKLPPAGTSPKMNA